FSYKCRTSLILRTQHPITTDSYQRSHATHKANLDHCSHRRYHGPVSHPDRGHNHQPWLYRHHPCYYHCQQRRGLPKHLEQGHLGNRICPITRSQRHRGCVWELWGASEPFTRQCDAHRWSAPIPNECVTGVEFNSHSRFLCCTLAHTIAL
ncbi:hypothetical protein K493DRAFT_62724, partial [Basidiobolus meristosporus CBS 931.73]